METVLMKAKLAMLLLAGTVLTVGGLNCIPNIALVDLLGGLNLTALTGG
jgi:hypothetical protein